LGDVAAAEAREIPDNFLTEFIFYSLGVINKLMHTFSLLLQDKSNIKNKLFFT